ncbi:MAG TPA: xanthine dehydrogenase small subunit [Casimicrobiaceae bacterium]|nr:xanthine dehydrogenase small subunit [Casimicrobiaceae bacterium]
MSEPIRFLLNGERVEVAGLPPQTTLLEFLRDERRLTGTKEGCAEGDCGACTVVIAERNDGRVDWKPINACIRFLPSIDGKAVFTIESLKSPHGELHPVQQALVDCHASQCGFCTPGFAMSLFGLYKTAPSPSRSDIDDALAGNLCRCTGYRPIVEAAQRMYLPPPPSGWRGNATSVDNDDDDVGTALAAIARTRSLEYTHGGQRWSAPRGAAEVAQQCGARPDARIIAGMTDAALWVTKQHRMLDDIIYVGDAADLASIRETNDGIEIGCAVALTDAVNALNRAYPELTEVWQRFASIPIRNSATLCGNIANGSPIGDSMPALIALGAIVEVRSAAGARSVALDSFYPGFRQTALARGEFVAAVRIPPRPAGLELAAYKISKRYDQDISAVFACFALVIDADRVIQSARIGCGGVAATPIRALKTERALVGSPWNADSIERAAMTLSSEFTPIDDMRASASYRRAVLGNLLRRCFHQTSGSLCAPLRIESLLVAADE